jgi:Protein of unknown function (DUF2695)
MDEQDFIASITPDVMPVLESCNLFARLDDLLCPENAGQHPEKCDGTYRLSEKLLRENGFDEDDLCDVFNVLHAQGGCCDCEVLYNVSESNRLKASYWKARALQLGLQVEDKSHHG